MAYYGKLKEHGVPEPAPQPRIAPFTELHRGAGIVDLGAHGKAQAVLNVNMAVQNNTISAVQINYMDGPYKGAKVVFSQGLDGQGNPVKNTAQLENLSGPHHPSVKEAARDAAAILRNPEAAVVAARAGTYPVDPLRDSSLTFAASLEHGPIMQHEAPKPTRKPEVPKP